MEVRLKLLGAPDVCRQKKCNYVRFYYGVITLALAVAGLQPFS